jgi:hypothetical protein
MRWVIASALYHAATGPSGRPHKVDYRRIRLPARFPLSKAHPRGNKKPHQPGVDAMLALVEAHPNIDVMVFYLIASAILVAALYHFHHKRTE